MDQTTRNNLQSATQQARRLLERDITEQLEGIFDIMPDGTIADGPGQHLDDAQRLIRTKLVEAIHHRAADSSDGSVLAAAVADYTREAAFTILNRYVALKMLEARGLVQQCVTKGDQSSGFKEFYLAAPGLLQLPDKGYRLYLECLFDELSTEVKILFDRHDAASLLWPRRQAFDALLALLNADDIASVWKEDETIGWVYQYFNSQEERRKMRDESQAPRNSRELAVRNQFFTPRYVVEFLTDNTLGRTWYEMRQGTTRLTGQCRYLVRRPTEIFLGDPQFAGEGLLGKPDNPEGREIPATVAAAFRGDLANALKEKVGSYQWWIGLAIPVDQWAKIIGREPSQLADESLLNDVLDGLRNNPDSPELQDPLRIWCALGHMALTSSGGPYAIEPSRLLWEGLKRAYEADSKLERSQEEMLRQPVLIAFRPKKDPRDLKILDPACGSSHFLLYCFDLLLTIYEEAWHDAYSPPALDVPGPDGESPARTLREDYPTLEKLREALPGLILRHNLHGIDIDPRCAQIGAFALWMRAQRAYNDFKLPKDQRPQIRRSNIVVAEPMPGEEDLFEEFLRNLKEDRLESLIREALNVPADRKVTATKAMAQSLCDLVRTIWNTMKLAGEAGSLLRIDKELEDAIAKGRAEWEQKLPLFRVTEYGLGDTRKTSLLKVLPGEEADFWAKSEMLVLHALRQFAASSGQTANSSFRRGLFAEDAAQGLAFIDQSRIRPDVVLMNPPFGNCSLRFIEKAKKDFGRLSNDIYACFVRRMGDLLIEGGLAGIISSRSFATGRGMEALRPHLLGKGQTWLRLFWDFGGGVLDGAMVETAAYVFHHLSREPLELIGFWNDKDSNKATLRFPSPELFSLRSYAFFRALPKQQFMYEADARAVARLNSVGKFEPDLGRVTKGLSTCSNERFVRCLWEIPLGGIGSRWEFLSKGGEYRWLSCDLHLALNWNGNGEELAVFSEITNGNAARARQSSSYYFKPAVCFSGRSQKGFSARWLPAGCIFDTKSPVIVPRDSANLSWLLPILMSAEYQRLISLQSKFGSYDTSAIGRLPLPQHVPSYFRESLNDIWLPQLQLERATETTVYFVRPVDQVELLKNEAVECIQRIDDLLQQSGLTLDPTVRTLTTQSINSHDLFVFSASHWLSYAFGCSIGRWDIRYATNEKPTSELLDPFLPLPACPPGLLQNMERLPMARHDAQELQAQGEWSYPIDIPWDGILLDEPGHSLDVEARVHHALKVIGHDRCEALARESCEILEVKTPREYFRNNTGFFSDHLKRYSKSRRQAPIYWRLSTASGRYSCWLYYHRFTRDTLFILLTQHVKPKVGFEEQRLGRLRVEAGETPTQSQRQELESQETFIGELRAFCDELERVVPLWNPNLDDGVIINFAPLWRLVPHHKAWQKECKACWDSLCDGEYDWSHLAMHLWPQRVVPKCAEDASLAIAHGLQEVFWEKNARGKWVKKRPPAPGGWQPTIDKLVAERSSRPVQDALAKLLAAPVPERGNRRGRAAPSPSAAPTGEAKPKRGRKPKASEESANEGLF